MKGKLVPLDLQSDPRYLQASAVFGEKVRVTGYAITVVKSESGSGAVEISKDKPCNSPPQEVLDNVAVISKKLCEDFARFHRE